MFLQINAHVKLYRKHYLLFIFAMAVIIVAGQVVIQYDLNQQNEDARVINLSGRQRMLSQRIGKRLLYIQNDFTKNGKTKPSEYDSLRSLVNRFEKVHFGLQKGDLTLGISAHNSPEIDKLLAENTQPATKIVTACRLLISQPSMNSVNAAVGVLEENELVFLPLMERTVAQYEREAKEKLKMLKRIELALTALSIVVLLLFILLPPINRLKSANTSLSEANQAFESLAYKLTRQNERLSNFAHITSHNLRSPVSNLNSILQFYLEAQSEEEKAFMLEKFKKVMHHLSSTLDELIKALQIKNELDKEREGIFFEDVVKKIMEVLAGQIMTEHALITFDFSRAPKIEYNKGYLESIMLNLLSNAIKYRALDRDPVIAIDTDCVYERIVLTIKDNGMGMDTELYRDQLFGYHKTFHNNIDAKGVGLFITKTQVEAMGGTISVESKVDEGTTFKVIL